MPKGKPNKLIAPIVIAGITVGFLVSAYKFIIHDHKSKKSHPAPQPETSDPENTESLVSKPNTSDVSID